MARGALDSPLHFLRFTLWGSGEVAPVTREILRRPEPGRSRRPHVHAGLRTGRIPGARPRPNYSRVVTGGKVVEDDYGTRHGKIFIGSESFCSTSLNQNRELGLIISAHAVMSAIAGTFGSDFRNGKHWSSA